MIRTVTLALVAGLALTLIGPVAAEEGSEEEIQAKVLEQLAPTVVTVKFVMKVHFQAGVQEGDREIEREVSGVVVGADGLIVLSNTELTLRPPSPQVTLTVVPTDFKVILPDDDDETEHEAVLAAKDSNLGLAFVAFKDASGVELSTVDFATSTKARIGQRLRGVTRLSRGFDFAPLVSTHIVLSKVHRPRKMHLTSGTFSSAGMVLHDADGKPVGILSVQEGAGVGQRVTRLFLLPGDVVNASIEQAAKSAKEVLEKLAADEAEKAAEGEAEKPGEHEEGEGEGEHGEGGDEGEGEGDGEHEDDDD